MCLWNFTFNSAIKTRRWRHTREEEKNSASNFPKPKNVRHNGFRVPGITDYSPHRMNILFKCAHSHSLDMNWEITRIDQQMVAIFNVGLCWMAVHRALLSLGNVDISHITNISRCLCNQKFVVKQFLRSFHSSLCFFLSVSCTAGNAHSTSLKKSFFFSQWIVRFIRRFWSSCSL